MARKSYSSDLTDAEWARLEPLLPPAKPGGRPRTTDLREVLHALCYVLRTGCAWRDLPGDFPPWGTAWSYFRTWRDDGTWERLHDTLRGQVRTAAGKAVDPSGACLDSQTVQTTDTPGPRGYDGGKKLKGRKRHVLVDTLGLLHGLVVHPASVQDRDGAKRVLRQDAALAAHLGGYRLSGGAGAVGGSGDGLDLGDSEATARRQGVCGGGASVGGGAHVCLAGEVSAPADGTE